MGTGYLLDTNVIIDFSGKKLPDNAHQQVATVINSYPKISIINKIELLSTPNVSYQILFFVEEAEVFALSDEIANQTIALRKKYKIKLPDAVIAATALIYDLVIITHNVRDFHNIKGLRVIDSYLLSLNL